MRKIIASLLAVVMVVCAFSTMSVSAAETNLLAGLSYTYTTDSTSINEDGSLMTDGKMRGVGESAWNGDLKLDGVSMEMMGTGKYIEYTFTLAETSDVAVIVFKNVRLASNRQFGTLIVNGGTPILSTSDVLVKTAVAGAPLYGMEAPVDQFFDITVPVNLTDVSTLTVKVITDAYVMQFDEIEAYATASSTEEPVVSSEDAPVASEDAPVASEDAPVASEDAPVVSEDAPVASEDAPVASEDAPVASEDAPVASEDAPVASEDPVSGDDSADDVIPDVPVAEVTYTVTASINEDGTVNLSATLPAGIVNGKIVLKTSADLAYVEGSGSSPIGGTLNVLNVAELGAIVSFSGIQAFEEGSVVLTADYTLADGATLDVSDIIVDTWNLGDGEVMVGTQADGDVIKVIVSDEPVDSSDVSVEAPVVSEDAPVVSEDAPVVSEDAPVVSEDAPVESSDAPASSEQPDDPDKDTPDTGDLGIAVFAVLAVISAGAVVVLKKKA